MKEMTLHRTCRSLRCELCAWQRGALGLLILSTVWNGAQTARIGRLESACRETAAQLAQAEEARDCALGAGEACPQGSEGAAQDMEKLIETSLEAERERQARITQAAQARPERSLGQRPNDASQAAGAYQYIGECTITAYCPCAECCGRWADGLTATGLPAEPGIVAVDPAVIPLGSTVVIDGQEYLAADTGVTGLHVDVCLSTHRETVAFGVRTAEVWAVDIGGENG